jgi:GH15 family glucan-1,4-alpha-glucosidase
MGRPVTLSNGGLYVGLNEHGLVHDFYYPYVGLDNLTTARSVHHKIGIWVDGIFSWVDSADWSRVIDFEEDSLVSKLKMLNTNLGIELHFADFVDHTLDAFCRFIKVVNLTDKSRDVRMFMHQVFQISRAGRADTALYVPDLACLYDYKGHIGLLIYAQGEDGQPFDQYAIGNYGIEGKEGTFKDAEDGELSGNAVEHGGVDTVLRQRFTLAANGSFSYEYWIVAGNNQVDCRKTHALIKGDGLAKRLELTKAGWAEWFAIGADRLHVVDPKYLAATKKSMMIVKAHIDKRGSVLASGDSSIFNYGRDYYCYFWPRDGAYAIWPLIRLGYKTEAQNYFDFCRDVLHPGGYMEHKYQPDRAIGSTWHPLIHGKNAELAIQEDETAAVIYMLNEYLSYTKDIDFVQKMYDGLILPAANFMASFIDKQTQLPHPSYDLWEEKFATHCYSVCITQAALRAAANMATRLYKSADAKKWTRAADSINSGMAAFLDKESRYAMKSIALLDDSSISLDRTLDMSSFYGLFMFSDSTEGVKQLIKSTLEQINSNIAGKSPSGGYARYVNDWYMRTNPSHPGNPWFICSLWMAQYAIEQGNRDEARQHLDWVLDHCYNNGVLAEQINSDTGSSVGVAPLVWSHAEVINTILDL